MLDLNDRQQIQKLIQDSVKGYLRIPQNYVGNPVGNIQPRYFGDTCVDPTNNNVYVSDGLTTSDWVKTDAMAPTISSGAGAPASTPSKVGDLYIDTTGKRKYIATGTSSSADWLKEPVFTSGTKTVVGGGGDITITLPWDWSGGYVVVNISTNSAQYFNPSMSESHCLRTSYIALTDATYTNYQGSYVGNSTSNQPFDKTGDYTGNLKSATTTTIVLNDGPAGTTIYAKYFVWARRSNMDKLIYEEKREVNQMGLPKVVILPSYKDLIDKINEIIEEINSTK